MSTSTTTPEQSPTSNRTNAVHQPFSWINDDARDYPMADFLALTVDVCNGVHTCLEIVNSRVLERAPHADAIPAEEATPAVTMPDAENLLRLSIAVTKLLRAAAERNIHWINAHGAEHLQAMKGSEGN